MSAYSVVLASVTAETGTTQKCPVLVAGIQSAIQAAYLSRSDQDMKPQACKALDIVLAEIAASNAALLAALIA
jgi:hypothetical protein